MRTLAAALDGGGWKCRSAEDDVIEGQAEELGLDPEDWEKQKDRA